FLVVRELYNGTIPSPGGFDRAWWDPATQTFKKAQIVFTADSDSTQMWERGVFSPAGLGTVPSYGEPGLAGWTGDLANNHNGALDPGEPSTTTDARGNYAFNVAPGTYTVAEVLQPGWTQTQPAGGTYTVPVAAGQSVLGLDFGNHQNPAPPPPDPVDTH